MAESAEERDARILAARKAGEPTREPYKPTLTVEEAIAWLSKFPADAQVISYETNSGQNVIEVRINNEHRSEDLGSIATD